MFLLTQIKHLRALDCHFPLREPIPPSLLLANIGES